MYDRIQCLRRQSLPMRIGIFICVLVICHGILLVNALSVYIQGLSTLLIIPSALLAVMFDVQGIIIGFCSMLLFRAVIVSIGFKTLWWSWPTFISFIFISLMCLAVMYGVAHWYRAVVAGKAAKIRELQVEQQLRLVSHLERDLKEAREQFFQNVSHELRTPLTELRGYIDLLRDHLGSLDSSMQSEFLAHAAHGCDELELFVNNVIEAEYLEKRHEITCLTEVNMAHLVKQTIVDTYGHNQLMQRMHMAIPEQIEAWADPQKLKRVLHNLLSNALKYSPVDAPILISVTLISSTQPTTNRPYICVRIRDQGTGISAEDMQILFQKGVRLKRNILGNVRGSGLGLYICKQLVEDMGGRIWVESKGAMDEGSCFCFTLSCASCVESAVYDAQKEPEVFTKLLE